MSNKTRHNAHNSSTRPSPDEDALYSIAEARSGYFTAAEAASAGYSRSLLSHHTRSGLLERIDRGVYRLSRYPEAAHADLVVASLRAGGAAVVSHESALGLYELSDVLPREVHVTVPRTASHRKPGLRVHTGRVASEDVTTFDGVRITTVERTLADVARAALPDELVIQAVTEALARGLTTPKRLGEMSLRRGGRLKRLVAQVLTKEHKP